MGVRSCIHAFDKFKRQLISKCMNARPDPYENVGQLSAVLVPLKPMAAGGLGLGKEGQVCADHVTNNCFLILDLLYKKNGGTSQKIIDCFFLLFIALIFKGCIPEEIKEFPKGKLTRKGRIK